MIITLGHINKPPKLASLQLVNLKKKKKNEVSHTDLVSA